MPIRLKERRKERKGSLYLSRFSRIGKVRNNVRWPQDWCPPRIQSLRKIIHYPTGDVRTEKRESDEDQQREEREGGTRKRGCERSGPQDNGPRRNAYISLEFSVVPRSFLFFFFLSRKLQFNESSFGGRERRKDKILSRLCAAFSSRTALTFVEDPKCVVFA